MLVIAGSPKAQLVEEFHIGGEIGLCSSQLLAVEAPSDTISGLGPRGLPRTAVREVL